MKKLVIAIVFVIFLLGGAYLYLIVNKPLISSLSAWTSDKHIMLVEVGNKSKYGNIHFQKVLVNNDVSPSNVQIQVNHTRTGFVITDRFEGEDVKKYNFKDIQSVPIPAGHSSQKQHDKIEEGTATEEDKIYAITIRHDSEVQKIIIQYRYMGLSYEEVISVK